MRYHQPRPFYETNGMMKSVKEEYSPSPHQSLASLWKKKEQYGLA
jgi:hypothetical protein